MCSYSSVSDPNAVYCDLSDYIWIYLEQNEDSWVNIEFDQAYNLEILKIRKTYEQEALGVRKRQVSGSVGETSVVIWIEFSDGKRESITLTEDSEVWNEVVFAKLILTTFVKFGIEAVNGPNVKIALTGVKIFGCYLSKLLKTIEL